MYGQFQNAAASAAKWIFIGSIVVIVMALLLGLNVKGATWLNKDIATADANRINIENAHQQATYDLQLRLAGAQTEAEIDQIQREQKQLDAQYDHDVQLLAQDLVNRQRWTDALIPLVVSVGGLIGLAAIIGILLIAIGKYIAILRSTQKQGLSAQPKSALPQENVIWPTTENETYQPIGSPMTLAKANSTLYDERVEQRFQELKRQHENDILIKRMKYAIDSARISSSEYHKKPLAT
jgi:multidrug efflux pump subunit AcrA (membrane-fusion protein)